MISLLITLFPEQSAKLFIIQKILSPLCKLFKVSVLLSVPTDELFRYQEYTIGGTPLVTLAVNVAEFVGQAGKTGSLVISRVTTSELKLLLLINTPESNAESETSEMANLIV